MQTTAQRQGRRKSFDQGKIGEAETREATGQTYQIVADAFTIAEQLPANSVDVIVTSPPYWKKRDYGHQEQLGQEATPQEFAHRLADAMDSWRPLLKPTSSVFINLGDSVRGGCVVGVPTLFETEAMQRGWKLISRIMWAKSHGMPNPHDRLAQRHEWIFQFSLSAAPFCDTFAYGQQFNLAEGNIWHIGLRPSRGSHLAPFPEELPRRALLLACPERVCISCDTPHQRITERGLNLDPQRPQARRALELWHQYGLGEHHLEAIRATGICDAGKSLRFQTGAGRNRDQVQKLAKEAKQVLGGYFREFTFALPEHTGWRSCGCGETEHQSGLALDPFVGTGTTIRAARAENRRCIGADLLSFDDVC